MRTWWRKSGRTLNNPVSGITGATRAPGPQKISFTPKQIGKLAPGSYELVVEASREAGGRELLRMPLFGWHNLKHGTIVVDRAGAANAMRKLIADARVRFQQPRQLLIFPEGTRRAPGAPPAYKPGVAGMYRDLEVPCVPIATNTGVHISAQGVATSPGTVVYEILEPIPAGLKRADFMRLLEERIETASRALLTEG